MRIVISYIFRFIKYNFSRDFVKIINNVYSVNDMHAFPTNKCVHILPHLADELRAVFSLCRKIYIIVIA